MQNFYIPKPIVNKKEYNNLEVLTKRYEKLNKKSILANVGEELIKLVPDNLKSMGLEAVEVVKSHDQYSKMMSWVSEGFNVIEEQASKFSISEKQILKAINKLEKYNDISEIEEICLVRSYKISKVVNDYKNKDLINALIEGGGTGYFGFAGLPFNIVFSTFLYFRAVQSIAIHYGYDIKNDNSELVIASQVFMKALSPLESDGDSEVSSLITKIMVSTQVSIVKQTANKTWAEMINKGGLALLFAQMRALANKAAQKAIEKAGIKSLENSLFRESFEQIGKKLTLKVAGMSAPVIGAIFGALIDTAQMKRILEYADIFYQKRFILEKESRIALLYELEQ